jgi:uncharacterized membrane protein (UPF0127 family)
MKRTVVLIITVLLIAGCGGADEGSGGSSDDNGDTRSAEGQGSTSGGSSLATSTVRIGVSGGESVEIEVEIADDTEEMARGLMGRTALAEDAGMLFVYPDERELSFWMKDTLIPLSIAFMDSEGRIVDIQDMKALDDAPPHYTSAEPARYALEVNEGFFDERGVEVGDRAKLPAS